MAMHRSCTFQVFQMGSQTTWKAKWLIFKAIVAGFRGKVAQTNSTHGVPGRITPSLFRSFDLFFFFREIVFASIATRKRHSTSRALASHVACFGGFDPQKWRSKQQEPGSSKALGMWTPTKQTLEKWYFDDLSSDTSLFRFQRHQTQELSAASDQVTLTSTSSGAAMEVEEAPVAAETSIRFDGFWSFSWFQCLSHL